MTNSTNGKSMDEIGEGHQANLKEAEGLQSWSGKAQGDMCRAISYIIVRIKNMSEKMESLAADVATKSASATVSALREAHSNGDTINLEASPTGIKFRGPARDAVRLMILVGIVSLGVLGYALHEKLTALRADLKLVQSTREVIVP